MQVSTADALATAAICNQILDDLYTMSLSMESALRIIGRPYQRKRLRNALTLLGAVRRRVVEIKSQH